MCGIAGIYNYAEPDRPVDQDLLRRMTRSLAHRGPDDEGLHVDGPLGLGNRRLAIVDLSPTGHQPMANEDGACWITYNGEFYNHRPFRDRLAAQGHAFRGSSDTETMLHLLEGDGPDALRDAAGIFGLAFWDGRRRELVLARDPLGVKQLYYHDDGRRIVFASEIKSLLECAELPREPDPEAVNQYLHFHTPLFERTFFRHVRQLRPGEYVRIDRLGIRRRTYWRVDDFESDNEAPEKKVAELRERLAEVVKDQLLADVQVGAFFSGGIDSTAVAAFATRAGQPPPLFGLHFSGQGVIDERPYQEAAARALGLELRLATMDGASFPDEMARLIRVQDQPVIGPAMFPMYHVSRLAAEEVKVCMGGQAADEIFGGYARYALTHPLRVAAGIAARRRRRPAASDGGAAVGGNLWAQLADPRTIRRLASVATSAVSWRSLYFENFAKVSESDWRAVFADPDFVSRRSCRQIFDETLDRSPAQDPGSKAMHWDLQTYLPGLFQQDDRMSMAHSLESRVPLADPRLVQYAFQLGFDLKIRGDATKWILRQALADVIPADVLNRRKVGFDTPIKSWMEGQHAGFVRETLLSGAARRRGFWNPRGLEALLARRHDPTWLEMTWKALCVETWASQLLDTAPAAPGRGRAVEIEAAPAPPSAAEAAAPRLAVGALVQEARELGAGGTAFRIGWELGLRSGLLKRLAPSAPSDAELGLRGEGRPAAQARLDGFPIASADEVAAAMADRLPEESVERLVARARLAARGRVLAFGRRVLDYGSPIDWHRDPVSGRRWPSRCHWSAALDGGDRIGDVKLTWEVARFPHAYEMARASAFRPELAEELGGALAEQIRSFLADNPFGRGVHWASSQEAGIRLQAWVFAYRALARRSPAMAALAADILRAVGEAAVHTERYLVYAQHQVHNNHLLAEAVLLLMAAHLLPDAGHAARWRERGLSVLTDETERQFYPDGAYIQQSHNYQRVALQSYLWASLVCRGEGADVPVAWQRALERSLAFLIAHQNPGDGRLPNFGSNDGAMPLGLSTCDFSDFRPVLQTVNLQLHCERIYEPGPWDETAAWLLGPAALARPLARPVVGSASFVPTGYHVLRGRDAASFGAFRCGTVRDRFPQIDMLHLDVWWRGQNLLVDPGSYLYNGPPEWHDHFTRTAAHNTVLIDDRDQMLHLRKFKSVYWTKAELLRFEDTPDWAVVEGEHYGYTRHPGACVHRRAVLFAKDDLWVVVDRIAGTGAHDARLHWLAAPFAHEYDDGRVSLATPAGDFSLAVFDEVGNGLSGDLVAGRESPPRGWHSRYYTEKEPALSLVVRQQGEVPLTFVTVMGAGQPTVEMDGRGWRVRGAADVRFELVDGRFGQVAVGQPVSAR